MAAWDRVTISCNTKYWPEWCFQAHDSGKGITLQSRIMDTSKNPGDSDRPYNYYCSSWVGSTAPRQVVTAYLYAGLILEARNKDMQYWPFGAAQATIDRCLFECRDGMNLMLSGYVLGNYSQFVRTGYAVPLKCRAPKAPG